MENEKSQNGYNQLPENIPRQGAIGDATLYDIMNVGRVLIKDYTDGQIRKQELENQIEIKFIEEESKRLRRNSVWLFVLSGLVLGITAILLFTGREQIGFDLLKLTIGFGGAIMGGIGWATYKRSKEED
jgi:hypothetical protein